MFDYTLPNSFVGQPFEQGKAVVEFAGTVKDTADQTQEAHDSLPVVKEPILLVDRPGASRAGSRRREPRLHRRRHARRPAAQGLRLARLPDQRRDAGDVT